MKNVIPAQRRYLLSIAEAAWLLGVDVSCVCRAIRVGALPVVRRRNRVLIPAHVLAHLAVADDSCADTRVTPVRRGDAR